MLMQWTKSLIFLQEEATKLNQPIEFEKFELGVAKGSKEALFLHDEPDYSYKSLTFNRKKTGIAAWMDWGSSNETKEVKKQRSIEILSDSGDEGKN